MSPKKRKRINKDDNGYNPEELEDLGIYDDESDEEIDEKEAWRYYG